MPSLSTTVNIRRKCLILSMLAKLWKKYQTRSTFRQKVGVFKLVIRSISRSVYKWPRLRLCQRFVYLFWHNVSCGAIPDGNYVSAVEVGNRLAHWSTLEQAKLGFIRRRASGYSRFVCLQSTCSEWEWEAKRYHQKLSKYCSAGKIGLRGKRVVNFMQISILTGFKLLSYKADGATFYIGIFRYCKNSQAKMKVCGGGDWIIISLR